MENKNKSVNLIQDMATDEFINFCRKKIIPALMPMEKQRVFYIVFASIVGAVGVAVCSYLFGGAVLPSLKEGAKSAGDLLYMFVTLIFVFYSFVYMILKHYKTKAKETVFGQLFSYWGNFKYFAKNKEYCDINETYIHSLDLFYEFNRYKCDDFISGEYNGLNITIQELDLKRVTGSGKNRRVINIFNGILVTVPSKKKFKGKTIVTTDKGFFNSFNGLYGFSNVKLEDPVFERIFEVYSMDQVEARYLLTTAFMDRLVKMACKNRNIKLMCSFENDNVHIAFVSSKDWFEIPVSKPVTDIRSYQSVLLELATILSVVDGLQIDSDIGM